MRTKTANKHAGHRTLRPMRRRPRTKTACELVFPSAQFAHPTAHQQLVPSRSTAPAVGLALRVLRTVRNLKLRISTSHAAPDYCTPREAVLGCTFDTQMAWFHVGTAE